MKKLRHDLDDPAGERHGGEPVSVVARKARRYWQMTRNAIGRPWWAHSDSPHPERPCCSGLSGLVFRFDDPIWRSLYPPNSPRCMCHVRALTRREVAEQRFEETASYDGREGIPVIGRENAENRGYRLHYLSADRREVTPWKGWSGRPVACEPAEVYNGGRHKFGAGGMIVPPDVSLPDVDPGDRALPVATRRLARLRLHALSGLAAVLVSDPLAADEALTYMKRGLLPEVGSRGSSALLWAKAWDIDVAEAEALAGLALTDPEVARALRGGQ